VGAGLRDRRVDVAVAVAGNRSGPLKPALWDRSVVPGGYLGGRPPR
jgi:hypothetical protein